ncbi:MAG: hypothetical protein AAB217_09690, partial [Chloroflexota bacterium]
MSTGQVYLVWLITGIDNDGLRLEEVRLGMTAATPGGMAGTVYFDGFQSWASLPAPYRATENDYVPNFDPAKWIIDRVRRQTLKDINGVKVSEALYAYDGNAPGGDSVALTLGELKYAQAVNLSANQSVDSGYVYDSYGNVIKTCAYTGYGVPGSLPATACSAASGPFRASTVTYDAALQTYALTQTNPLTQTVSAGYDYALAAPTTATDLNGNITTTAYDGLGRVTGITYPGYGQPNVKYIYPALVGGVVAAPFKLEMQAWDETPTTPVYRSAWTFYDGLGRALQVQGPAETGGQLILADTKYNAMGLTLYSGLPRQIAGTGGTYYAPTWTGVPHTTSAYDALGRSLMTTFADGTTATVSYNGLQTSLIDQNGHKKLQEVDAFGRLVTVEEYTGTDSMTSLYATTD